MSYDLNCPYCDAKLDVCHDDGQGYEEDVSHQMTCINCGKAFVFTTCVSFDYDSCKADCLNGGEHDYQPTNTFPKEFSMMRCTMCDIVRELTDEERLKFDIGTPNSYFESIKP